MLKRICFLFFIFHLLFLSSYSQQNNKYVSFEGKVADSQGEPVLYASIYIEETKSAYATDAKGAFILRLKPGIYTFRISHIHYDSYSEIVHIDMDMRKTFNLSHKKIMLKELEVKPGKEDPAYAIMRKTIAKAPYYRKQLFSYEANIYNKGTMKIEDIPKVVDKALQRQEELRDIRIGDVFVRESTSLIKYEDDSLQQTVLSIQNSFPSLFESSSFDDFFLYNIYDNPKGDFISPLAPTALTVYNFKLETITYHDNKPLYHIRLAPKNNNPYAYTGTIVILDSSWHVFYFDLTTKLNFGIASLEVNIRENFGELEKNLWLPYTCYLFQKMQMFGFRVSVQMPTSIHYNHYKRNDTHELSLIGDTLPLDTSIFVISKRSEKLEKKIEMLFQKEELTNRDVMKLISWTDEVEKKEKKKRKTSKEKNLELELKKSLHVSVDSMALHRDSSYWEKYRHIPLTEEEIKSFEFCKKQDSLIQSTGKGNLTEGTSLVFSKKNYRFGVYRLDEYFQFNPVDGVKLRPGFSFEWTFKNQTTWKNIATIGYSFNQKHILFSVHTGYEYFPEKMAHVAAFGGKESFDFNLRTGVKPFGNTLGNLFFKNSSITFYDRAYWGLEHKIEAFNGFDTRVAFSYEWREELKNTTEYAFFYKKKRTYPSNIPNNSYLKDDDAFLEGGRAALLELELSYTPRRHYYYRDRKKYATFSHFPTFTLLWRKGISHFIGSKTNFDYLQFSVSQKITNTTMRNYDYSVLAGWFPNRKKMHFSEFYHTQIYVFPLSLHDLSRTFHALNVYYPSTNEWVLSGFFRYEALYLLLKFIPGLNKTFMTESLYFSYLKTPHVKDYIEIGYSLNKILMFANIGVFVGFERFRYYGWNLKVSLTLP